MQDISCINSQTKSTFLISQVHQLKKALCCIVSHVRLLISHYRDICCSNWSYHTQHSRAKMMHALFHFKRPLPPRRVISTLITHCLYSQSSNLRNKMAVNYQAYLEPFFCQWYFLLHLIVFSLSKILFGLKDLIRA